MQKNGFYYFFHEKHAKICHITALPCVYKTEIKL